MTDHMNSVQHFQQYSRLHFIGQWRTKMEDLFKEWFRAHPAWHHGTLHRQALFLHLDMDAFFCSVQLAKPENAHLRDKPVGIAAGRFNSDIASCNYIARGFGVRAEMYANEARERCPDLIILGYDLPACERVTKTLYEILFGLFPPGVGMSIEVLSIDEVLIASDTDDYNVLQVYCERVRGELFRVTGCTASCGIAPNIMLARLATREAKPDGIRIIHAESVSSYMNVLPFSKIHGVGPKTLEKVCQLLCEKGVLSATKEKGAKLLLCADVQHLGREELQLALGKKAGETIFKQCRGQDSRVVTRTGDPEDQKALGKSFPSSVACSINYAVRPVRVDDVWSITKELVEGVCVKLRRASLAAQGIRVTLLERHPLEPRSVKKFAGRGRCVEVHVPVKLPCALDHTGAEVMLMEIQQVISPLLVGSREISDAERARQLDLQDDPTSRAMWTFSFASLRDIVIKDVRGITIQATTLKKVEVSNHPKYLKEQQLSLSEAFSHAKRLQQEESRDKSVEPLECFPINDSLSSLAFGVAGFQSSTLFRLSVMRWGDEFVVLWKEACTEACLSYNWSQTRVLLRCALWKMSEAVNVRHPREELQKLYDFVFGLTKQPITIQ